MDSQEILSKKLQSKLEQCYHDSGLIEPPSPGTLAKMVDFGSNDTLSLSSSGALTQAFMNQLAKTPNFRVGSTSTRVFGGTTQPLEALEYDLAQLHKAETALFFNSGYDANVAIWSTIPQPGDFVLHDEYIHASIRDGMRLGHAETISFPHNDYEAFRHCLQDLRDEHSEVEEGKALVFVSIESFYSMGGDEASVHDLIRISRKTLSRQNIVFSIDEAHSNGLVGPNGSGFVCHYGLEKDFSLRVNTCGKALGSAGAVVLTTQTIKNALINYARNAIYSTAPSFVTIAAVRAGYDLVVSEDGEKRRQLLQENVRHFYQALTGHSQWAYFGKKNIIRLLTETTWSTRPFQSPIIPLVTQPGKAISLAEHLSSAKFWANTVQYPRVAKTLECVRICMHAENTKKQIEALVAVIIDWGMLEYDAQFPGQPEMTMHTGKAVTLMGAGTQGSRLAYMWSKLGRTVYLLDKNNEQLTRALDSITQLRAEYKESEKWGPVITGSLSMMDTALSSSWLIVECVPEKLSIKKVVIEEVENRASPDIIIASNSSSFTTFEIAEGLSLHARDRLVSLHSYWPPETTAIEIMYLDETRPEIITTLMKETKAHGFQPFQVHRQSTGYMFNRIWAAIKREALSIIKEGVASPEEVDGIYKAITRAPKGPFEQMDVAGLDVILDIENHYCGLLPGLPNGPRELLHEMVSSGRLGVKTGRGFYDYGVNKLRN